MSFCNSLYVQSEDSPRHKNFSLAETSKNIKLFLLSTHHTIAPRCYLHHHFAWTTAEHPHSCSLSPFFNLISPLTLCSGKFAVIFASGGLPAVFLGHHFSKDCSVETLSDLESVYSSLPHTYCLELVPNQKLLTLLRDTEKIGGTQEDT